MDGRCELLQLQPLLITVGASWTPPPCLHKNPNVAVPHVVQAPEGGLVVQVCSGWQPAWARGPHGFLALSNCFRRLIWDTAGECGDVIVLWSRPWPWHTCVISWSMFQIFMSLLMFQRKSHPYLVRKWLPYKNIRFSCERVCLGVCVIMYLDHKCLN